LGRCQADCHDYDQKKRLGKRRSLRTKALRRGFGEKDPLVAESLKGTRDVAARERKAVIKRKEECPLWKKQERGETLWERKDEDSLFRGV